MELSLRCVRRDSFSRNLFEGVSARSGTRTKEVTSYNVRYGVLPCFPTFSTFLFRMRLDPEKPPTGSPKMGKTRQVVVDVAPKGRFLASTLLAGTMRSAFGLHRETIMDDDLKDVQPYLVKVWPERRGEGNSPVSRRGGPIGG